MRASPLVAASVALVAVTAFAQTGVPERLVFQGRLVRGDGTGETVPQNLRFSIYDQPTGGSPLWTETHQQVPLSNGYYAVELGSSTPLGGVFTGAPRWMAVALEDQQDLGARLPIATSPYAFLAGDAAKLGGLDKDAFSRSSHVHPPATTTEAGFLSAADKIRLDALPSAFGSGLTLGTTATGQPQLSVSFAGSGTATTAARSNHSHALPALSCTRRSASAPLNTGATAACLSTEEVTGGGCENVPLGTIYELTQMPVVNGYLCRGTGAQAPTNAVTAYAVCCKVQ
jgi:hypothetical protein